MQLESLDDLLFTHIEALEGRLIGPTSGMELVVYDAHARLIQAMSDQRDLLQGILTKLKPLHDVLDEEAGEAESMDVASTH